MPPSPAPEDVDMADSPSVWQGASAPSGDESSPMEEDKLSLDDNAPNNSASTDSENEGSCATTCAKTYPRVWILICCPTCMARLLFLLRAQQRSVLETQPMLPPAAASFLELESAPKEVVTNPPGAAFEMLKAGSRLVLRRRLSDLCFLCFEDLSNEPSIANSSGLRPFLTTPRSPLANTQTDLSRQTAANTFLNAFANSAGDLPPFSFAAPLLVDPALMAEPLPSFAETFHHYLSSTNNLTSEDPLLQYRYLCVCVSRLLKHFLDVYTPAPEYARIVSQMTEALELADAWHLATCPLFPPLNVTSGYA
ncbi:hypothetical protein PCANC_28548 [Puccinia coronata f. sp. avenae]|uniref:Uncharacterized protein n=1 Tax=Puccinia coronata f. sp. avenae TaxID=200324 RepID=A0A2N5RZP0_9BASI|nr:hypothetical protein PCANC_28548 [Puccinia coronata f. sp. avenae]